MGEMKLSICIPTYNRARHLENCLQSIVDAAGDTVSEFEVCVSDNGSDDGTAGVVARFLDQLPLKHNRNKQNLGIPRNFLKVVSLAEGEFAWLVGDDDLVLPGAIDRICEIVANNDVDHIYVNAAHLSSDYVDGFNHPFRTCDLPANMVPFSTYEKDGPHDFLDLIDPAISFDFLGGMFLSVFRRQLWLENAHHLDADALVDPRIFSHFDNTFPHLKIFCHALSKSKSWFASEPFLVCITGVREWAPMYPLVHSVRLPEALELYHRQGLSDARYHRARNFAVSNLLPELGRMWLYGDKAGYGYVSPVALLWANARYSGMYLSVPRFFLRKLGALVGRLSFLVPKRRRTAS
ncbi:glycosyltransferase family 2 protein [Pontivivens insulae]|uniref:Abequosyltransferase RfbV n=1 Tax=Pontivivens insulae TaxID=1639689 RepID=A0A2R8A7G7_9RHOB|nr:glycosyltransferase [Pontivivens insulae]RED18281.1 glycosyltransferase involved in cell wall biosynthesis [Pontivivens insulae]SPF28179.1 Abequosyltransferase RfbV [Pontivivens insulae]